MDRATRWSNEESRCALRDKIGMDVVGVCDMGELFNLDNKFFQGFNKIIDCAILNFLWLICCTPFAVVFYLAWGTKAILFWLICWPLSVPAGAATTALYYAVNKVIRHGRGYIWQEFWCALRTNFKQSAISSLVLAGVGLAFGADAFIMLQFAQAGARGGVLYSVFLVLIALVIMWALYLFPYIARFANGTKQVLKNAGLIALANLPWTILLFVVFCGAAFVIWILPPALLILPIVYMVIANRILEKVFLKYMSEEDLAAEEERNREYYN